MSLVENINKRRRAGKSRSKKNSTISKKAYAAMKKGWKEKGGLSMKYMMAGMKKYFKGGLKDIPSSNKGLPKLSKKVRNTMGYKKYGGKK